MKVVIQRAARAEMLAAARRYGEIRPELRERFEEALVACIDRIEAAPKQFPVIEANFRRALVEVFPYEVFFEVLDRKVNVLAIAHSSREPLYWLRRP